VAIDHQSELIGNRLRGRKVIVTGGAGFIGSNLCCTLAGWGANVIALDNFLPGGGANEANLRGAPVKLIRGDIRDIDLRPICEGADFIFNLAAYTGHAGAENEPLADLAINTAAQLRLILAVRSTAPMAVVVHTSTRQVYGKPERLPVDEGHPVVPPDANAVSKFAGEQYWMLEHRVRGRAVVALRLTNCYGPRLRILDGSQGFLGHWFGAALRGVPFEVWGGDQLRDLAYVDDVTKALIQAATVPDCHGRIFNVGGSAPLTLTEMADLLVHVMRGTTSYVRIELPVAQARIDIGSYYANDATFRAASGWAPTVDAEDGFRRTVEWYRSRLAAYLG
jgi:nucleoside-diphosphate-sugar epimerase